MAKLSTDELLGAFKEMTLLELSDFVKQFEETFGPKMRVVIPNRQTVFVFPRFRAGIEIPRRPAAVR